MLISSKNKGYMLLEVICSISIFSMIVFLMVPIVNIAVKIENTEKQYGKYSNLLYCIKNEIISNSKNETLENMCDGKVNYIHKEKLNIESIKNNNILDLINQDVPCEKPYGKILIENQEVFKIKIIIQYFDYDNEREVFCEFIKGKY